ncbi:VOC family protein [Streptomyces sp. NPDC008238]
MLTLGTIVLGVTDVRRAAAFWGAALDYVPRDGQVRAEDDWAVLVPAAGASGPGIALGASATPVQEHPRVHLDLYADDAAEQAAEVERLVALGAVRVDWDRYPPDPDFVVLADTEGNRFCVIDTSHG